MRLPLLLLALVSVACGSSSGAPAPGDSPSASHDDLADAGISSTPTSPPPVSPTSSPSGGAPGEADASLPPDPSEAGAPDASSPPSTDGVKWHPGHYLWLDEHTTQAEQFTVIDSLTSEPSVQGFQVFLNWSDLEGDTAGDYAAGFALVDAYLAKLATLKTPKHLMLGVNERAFGTPPAAGTSCAIATRGLLPAYLATPAYNEGCSVAPPGAAGSLAVCARFWEATVMDRLIALSLAYAQRYDGAPLFEMFMGNGETAVASIPGSGFSGDAYATQLARWYAASTPVWPHTQLRMAANYLGSNDSFAALIAAVTKGGGVIVGGPDPELPLPTITRTIQANEIFRDVSGVGDGTDFRSTVAWIGEVQALGLGQRYTQLPSDIFTYQYGTMHASYLVWLDNTWTGGTPQHWSTGILPFIQSIEGKSMTACPTAYTRGCDPR